MALLHSILVFLHILTAAAWFGMALRLSSMARKTISLQGEAAVAFADEGVQTVRMMGLFILLTFVFAMGILGVGGGYAGASQYHIASLLIVVLVILQYAVIRPAFNGLQAAIKNNADSTTFVRRTSMAVGMGHLLWITLLVLMFWNKFSVAV